MPLHHSSDQSGLLLFYRTCTKKSGYAYTFYNTNNNNYDICENSSLPTQKVKFCWLRLFHSRKTKLSFLPVSNAWIWFCRRYACLGAGVRKQQPFLKLGFDVYMHQQKHPIRNPIHKPCKNNYRLDLDL